MAGLGLSSGVRLSMSPPATDRTPPVLSSPTGSSPGGTTASLGVTTNEPNGTIYWVLTTSATPPSAVQVRAGQNNTGAAAAASGSQAIASSGAKTFNASGLTAATTYFAYFMHEDLAGNRSTVAAAASFTT